MLPNFLIIGSQKAGTTSLYNILKKHPQIYMPEEKEVNFFFRDKTYQRGIKYYESHFNNIPQDNMAIGEASPGYICHPKAAERIAKHLPDIKLILTVRNPIKRAYSSYWDNKRRLLEPKSFAEAIEYYLEDEYAIGQRGYFSRGVYIKYIETYLKYFDSSQLLILVFEDLISDPVNFYKKTFEFLGVDAHFNPSNIEKAYNPFVLWDNPLYHFFFEHPAIQKYIPLRLNRFILWGKRIEYKRESIDTRSKQILIDFYKPWNKKLSQFLGRDLSIWEK